MKNNRLNYGESKSKHYWKSAWTKATVIYFFVSLAAYILLIFIAKFISKADKTFISWQNAILVSAVFAITINTFVILIRKGFGKGLIRPIQNSFRNRIIMKRAKEKCDSLTTEKEKEAIIARERRQYEIEQNNKAKKKNLKETNNLSSYLLILYGIVMILILIPFWALKITF